MRRKIPIFTTLCLLAGTLAVRSEPDTQESLYTKNYRIDPAPLFALDFPELDSPTPTEMVQAQLGRSGVKFAESDGTKLFYNDRTGILLVRATLAQLEMIEHSLERLNVAAPQVQIEVRIAEYDPENIPAGLAEHLNKMLSVGNGMGATNALKASVITSGEFKLLMRALEQTTADLISAPTIVTMSGRQARIAMEEPKPIITDPPFTAPAKAMKAKWSPNPSPPEAK
jgi:type II secretory pathway component GspD/PulD (secretin)